MDLRLLIVVWFVVNGCASTGSSGNHCERVEELVLLTSPSGLNLDDQPGIDGFTAGVYAHCRHQARGMELRQGELQFELFDGIYRSIPFDLEPYKVWSFSAEQMMAQRAESLLGVRYSFVIQWEPGFVTGTDVTVRVRYEDVSTGHSVVSAPLTLAVRVKRVHGVEG